MKKKSFDLSRLRSMPEASKKSERIELSLVASLTVGVIIRRVSSTN